MTNLQKDNNHITVNKIIRTLSHMGRVEYRIGEKMVGFYKNSKLFGKIENGVIYLLDSLGQLKKLGTNIVLKDSVFILRAQIAYNAV
jgi:hypothetical protein